jgi:peptidoglycan/xylan/chitin deacetylase (PgdA/CDA1 family)
MGKFILRACAAGMALCALGTGDSLAKRVPLYSSYHYALRDYFYTTDPGQLNEAVYVHGYSAQGAPFWVEDDGAAPAAAPFWRFWKGAPQYDHFYTIFPDESSTVQSMGWLYERSEGYLLASPVYGTLPVHRLSSYDGTNGDLVHYYTVNQGESDYLRWYGGWTYDRVAGYAYPHGGALDNAEIAVLVYHIGAFSAINGDCRNYGSDVYAMQQDLETMYNNGFTVVPLRWALEWSLGQRDGSTLPQKPVAITFDDGYVQEWSATVRPNPDPAGCPGQTVTSARDVLLAFRNAHPDLPSYSPHATSFVVASPKARGKHDAAGTYGMWWLADDSWWAQAKQSGLIDIQNHSADHDNPAVGTPAAPTPDSVMGINLAVGGNVDGWWQGRGQFCRIGRDASGVTARDAITNAANTIGNIAGVRPDIFAAPYGNVSAELSAWFDANTAQHQHFAAFTSGGDWVRRFPGHSRFAYKRFVKGCHWGNGGELLDVLRGTRTAMTTKACADLCN